MTEILVCNIGGAWEAGVVPTAQHEVGMPLDTVWCETQTKAIKAGRRLFNQHPGATALKIESIRDFTFKTIRSR